MRILYQHRTLADGAEGVHIEAMVKAFRDLGHDVLVDGITSQTGTSRGTAVDRFRALVPRVAFEIASVGLNAVEYLKASRKFDAFAPDLLYKRHAKFDVGYLLAAAHRGVPSVLEVNCLFTDSKYERFEAIAMRRVAGRMERRALELANLVLAVSTPLGRDVKAIADSDVVVMPNGADPALFDPNHADGGRVRAQYGVSTALTVGWAGVVREWHGLESLVEAVAGLPEVTLLIVGDGPGVAGIEERATQLRVRSRVKVTGRISHRDMPGHVAAFDIAVVADERTGIASPMKLLEYMAMGRAIVAPDAENIRDLVTDGIDGLLFEPGNAQSLINAMSRLSADLELRKRLGAAARRKILQERNWLAIAQEVLGKVGFR